MEMTMKLGEFMDRFCQDILADHKVKSKTLPEIKFTYDYKITTEDGVEVKIINAAGYEIDINDILTLSENDFSKIYPGAEEVYRNYLSNFIILEGEEVLSIVRKQILQAKAKIERYSTLNVEDFDCKF